MAEADLYRNDIQRGTIDITRKPVPGLKAARSGGHEIMVLTKETI
ncbi:MAG: hypothetical protein ACLQUZ_07205 [Rhizomicrobium sp.]